MSEATTTSRTVRMVDVAIRRVGLSRKRRRWAFRALVRDDAPVTSLVDEFLPNRAANKVDAACAAIGRLVEMGVESVPPPEASWFRAMAQRGYITQEARVRHLTP